MMCFLMFFVGLHGELEASACQGVLQVPSKRLLDGGGVVGFLHESFPKKNPSPESSGAPRCVWLVCLLS